PCLEMRPGRCLPPVHLFVGVERLPLPDQHEQCAPHYLRDLLARRLKPGHQFMQPLAALRPRSQARSAVPATRSPPSFAASPATLAWCEPKASPAAQRSSRQRTASSAGSSPRRSLPRHARRSCSASHTASHRPADQPHIVTVTVDHAGPMMRAPTPLNPYPAGRNLRKEPLHRSASKLPLQNHFPRSINPVDLKTFFAKSSPIMLISFMDGSLVWSNRHHQSGT